MAKKKRSPEKMHRQVQDALQALPYMIDKHQKEGKKAKALLLRYLTGPMLKVMNRALTKTRYRGEEGKKVQQTDLMKRRLEQKQMALKQVQTMQKDAQKRKRPR